MQYRQPFDDLLCHCGKPSDGWPDEQADDRLCQNCWEAKCSKNWWAAMRVLIETEEREAANETA